MGSLSQTSLAVDWRNGLWPETLALVEFALDSVSARTKHLRYHNEAHSLQVVSAAPAIAIARSMVPTSRDYQLVVLAAAFHDFYTELPSQNELFSAKSAAIAMSEFAVFSEQDAQAVERMIQATEYKVQNSVIRQNVTAGDTLASIIADADLAALGLSWSEFYQAATSFYEERRLGYTPKSNSEIMRFLHEEVNVLSNHRFWLKESSVLFPHVQANAVRVKALQTVHAAQ
mgnify:CR=1 FL=1